MLAEPLCNTTHTSMKDFLQDVELHPHKNTFCVLFCRRLWLVTCQKTLALTRNSVESTIVIDIDTGCLIFFRYCCSYQSNLRMNDKPQCYNNTIITPISVALLGKTKSISRRNFLVKVQEGRRAGGLIMIEVFLLKRLIFSCDAANLYFVGPVSYDVSKDL